MARRGVCVSAAGLVLAIGVVLIGSAGVGAHERRQVGSYIMRVGWAEEPTFAGIKNAVQLFLSDSSGKAFTEIPEGLKVVVIFGSQKTGPLPLVAAFGRHSGQPGDFRAAVIPTRPGNYTFHFVGTLKGQAIDESFTSSETTFDPVQEAAAIEFPAKDPSAGELAQRLDRLDARLKEGAVATNRAETVGGVGVIAGIAGIVIGLSAGRRSSAGRVSGKGGQTS
jgi:hypothetical protein